jgi:hypothetical protein
MRKKWDTFKFIRWKPALNLIAGGVFLVVAVLLTDIPRMIASPGWPTTTGTILYHKFVRVKFKEYDGGFYTDTEVYIRYEYTVAGIAYTSLSIDAIDTLSHPPSYANRFPVGEAVTVYYNPKNPSDAVLEPGFVFISQAFGGLSFYFLVVGVCFIIFGILQSKKMRDRYFQKKLLDEYLEK